MLKKLLAIAGVIAALWLAFAVNSLTLPVVFLHYSASATAPVTYFFNEDNDIVKDHLDPGASIEFRPLCAIPQRQDTIAPENEVASTVNA